MDSTWGREDGLKGYLSYRYCASLKMIPRIIVRLPLHRRIPNAVMFVNTSESCSACSESRRHSSTVICRGPASTTGSNCGRYMKRWQGYYRSSTARKRCFLIKSHTSSCVERTSVRSFVLYSNVRTFEGKLGNSNDPGQMTRWGPLSWPATSFRPRDGNQYQAILSPSFTVSAT